MKSLAILFILIIVGSSAHAQVENRSFYGAGVRLGLGYTNIEFEQKISDTGTNFTSGASELSFLHLNYGYQWSSQLWLLAYGSAGTVTFDESPGAPSQDRTEMTGEVNLEARFHFGEHDPHESWVPDYIIGANADYMMLARAPTTASGGYAYDQVPIISPTLGVTTTLWGDRSAWRNTLRLGVPMFASSGLDVRSGYHLLAVTSYTFAFGEHLTFGFEGLISYLEMKLSENSQVTSLVVDHEITQFSVGPRVFFTVDW